jgi:hypothetical protein
MQTRTCAAATALLLTAAAGMAATGGAAEAAATHHAGAKAAKSLTVKITSTKKGPVLSRHRIRPGYTTFRIVHKSGGQASLELLRLRPGYSFKQLRRDIPKITGDPVSTKAVKRVDRNVVFYGGMDVSKKVPSATFAADIDRAGTYYVVNIFKGQRSTFIAKGHHQRRSHPSADGRINAGAGNVWLSKATVAHKGWIRTTNKAAEPHFVELDGILDTATDQDVADWFNNPSGPPTWMSGTSFNTEVISPGHTFYWKFSLPTGRYAIDCFFPSKATGMPHAFMGMYKVLTLG